jgi:hypothetical protein
MGRRCACDWLIDAMRTDPRLKVVPAAARWLWLSLADQLVKLPEPGVFLLGSRVGSARDIALMVSMPETDVETQLGTLLETGLIIQRADGVLCLPAVPEPSRRGLAARENGGFGGRPRRGETPEQARERRMRQRELPLMSVHGTDRDKTHETEPETVPDNPPRVRAAAASSFADEESKQAAAGFAELGAELAELAGFDPARGTYNFGPVKEWLLAGATPELLRDVVCRVASRGSYRTPSTLGYFTQAVRDEMKIRGASKPSASTLDPQREAIFAVYNRQYERYVADGCLGAPPVAPVLAGAAA